MQNEDIFTADSQNWHIWQIFIILTKEILTQSFSYFILDIITFLKIAHAFIVNLTI